MGNTPNQDNPLMKGANVEGILILGIDWGASALHLRDGVARHTRC